MTDYHHVSDSDECSHCGDPIKPDKDGEYRHRVLMEDRARSTMGEARAKLCAVCWHKMEAWVRGE